MAKIGFIGAGNMAEALIKGIIKAGVCKPRDIIISDIQQRRLELLAGKYRVCCAENNRRLAEVVDVLFLSIKPQNMQQVLEEIKGAINKNALVVSIAAGITTGQIQKTLGDIPVIRVMPNTPALIGQGAAAMYATKRAAGKTKIVRQIFSAVGIIEQVHTESMLDIVTAVSGSGPAYFFLLMEEMIKAAQKLGLKKDIAEKLVLQTARGAGVLAMEAAKENESPQDLRKKVTSPGGTTEAAIKVFVKHNFERMVRSALAAAARRSRQLSRRKK